MLEQQPPVFANPWDNQSSFRFPPASSSTDPASTGYQQHQHQVQQHRAEKQQQNNHPMSSSSCSSEYEPLNEDEEQRTGDTPYWLGGPLTDECLEPATSSGVNNNFTPTTIATTSMTTNNNNGNSSMAFMFKDQDQYQKREGELSFEREQIFHSQIESTLPYRRHSLAHETLSQQRKSSVFSTLPVSAEKRASFSEASPSSFIMGQQTPWMPSSLTNKNQFATAEDTAVATTEQQQQTNRFGMNNIWSTTKLKSALPAATANQQHQQQQSLLWEYGLVDNKVSSSTNSYTLSPTTSSSTSSQTLLPPSYAHSLRFTFGDRDLQQQQPLRTSRRLSLSPLPTTSEDSVQEHFNHRDILSSVPEEPGFLPYRRHSLAGPLLGVATTRSNTTPAEITAPASYLNEQRQQQRELDKFLPSNLLSSDLFESVDYSSHQQHHNLSTTMSWCMVEFKAGRSEIYHSTIPVEKDDWIIVEADRGRDLGKVVAKDLPADQVALLLQSTNSGMWEDPAVQSGGGIIPSPPNNASTAILTTSQSAGTTTSSSSSTTTPSTTTAPSLKRICRLATTAEITLLVTKRQDEQKALLICQTKSKQKKLMMDIVDAEYQWDRRKLTFYFVAERRVDFRELVRDLFKIYKTRIWMCSVNTMSKKQPM